MRSDAELLGAVYDARMERIERLQDKVKELEAEVERLKSTPRGDGYDCAQGCAHCCSQHTCEDC